MARIEQDQKSTFFQSYGQKLKNNNILPFHFSPDITPAHFWVLACLNLAGLSPQHPSIMPACLEDAALQPHVCSKPTYSTFKQAAASASFVASCRRIDRANPEPHHSNPKYLHVLKPLDIKA